MVATIVSALLGICFGAGVVGVVAGIALLITCLLKEIPKIRQVAVGMIICFVLLVVGSAGLIDYIGVFSQKEVQSSAFNRFESVELEPSPIMELSADSELNLDDAEAICKKVREAIGDAIGEGETIDDVTLVDKTLSIYVSLGDESASLIPFADLARSRVSTITSGILNEQYLDEAWETIMVSFDRVGYYSNIKDDILIHEHLGRYFDIDKLVMIPDETASQQSDELESSEKLPISEISPDAALTKESEDAESSALTSESSTSLSNLEHSDVSDPQNNNDNVDAEQKSVVQTTYIGNKNTLVFHESSCSHLPDTKNQSALSSRSEAIERGYHACQRCDP